MPPTPFETHDVFNQSPVFEDVNLYETDAVLRQAVEREGAAWAEQELRAFGAATGSARGFEIGRLANENSPRLRRFDQKGQPADRVEFHPAYHDAMAMSFTAGLHCRGWDEAGASQGAAAQTGRHVARLGYLYMITQMEPGHICPITMTHAAVPALRHERGIYDQLAPKIMQRSYDASFQPWQRKRSVTIGMGMTEKQGGTDVRANTTRATPVTTGGPGEEYILVGHKWFMSAPMSDAFLMLAQAPGGLSCFFVPRFLPDGATNPLRLQRLKDKLGNHSNASSEVELLNAHGWLIGGEGRGVATIIEMVTMTRLDCAVASAGQMRLALALAVHHCHHRSVFQKRLIDQPLMAQVLADMALDVEAATTLAFRLGRAFDRAESDEAEAAWRRVMTPVTKYWVCKAAPALGYEALECLGGNGYVEDGPAARLYREMPLNAIWEGSGNVMCLDLLRVLAQDGDQVRQVLAEIGAMAAGDRRLEAALAEAEALITSPADREATARLLLETIARIAAAALLRAHAPASVADAFITGHVNAAYRTTYGASGAIPQTREILARVFPFT